MRVHDVLKIDEKVKVKLEMTLENFGHQEFVNKVRVAEGKEQTEVGFSRVRNEAMTWLLYSRDGRSLSGRRVPSSYLEPKEGRV